MLKIICYTLSYTHTVSYMHTLSLIMWARLHDWYHSESGSSWLVPFMDQIFTTGAVYGADLHDWYFAW